MLEKAKRFFFKQFRNSLGSLIHEAILSRGFGQPIFNKTDTASLLENGYQGNADVYSIINYISTLAANVDWILFEVKDEKALKQLKSYDPISDKALLLQAKALEPITSHSALDTWNNPNQMQTRSEFVYNWCGWKLNTGNSFINGVKPLFGNNKTVFKELHLLPVQFTEILPGDFRHPVSGYQLNIGGIRPIKFEEENVNHSKYFNPDFVDGQALWGQSPLKAAFRNLSSSNEADVARMRAFQNQGAVGMISSATSDDDMRMSSAELKDLSDTYQNKFGGADNFNKVLFTTGMAKWDNMGLSPVDLAIMNSKIHDLRTLCNIYSVNSGRFNDPGNKRFNNDREGKKSDFTDAVMPLLNGLRDELNMWYIPPYEKLDGKKYFLTPDWKSVAVLQDDIQKLIAWLLRAWWISPNDKLRIQGLPTSTDPKMDLIYIPSNLVELGTGGPTPPTGS